MQKPAIFFSSEKFFLWVSLTGIALLYLLISLLAEGTYDSGDGIQHYLISRYSWKHPELFLHHWGKPFFILISSPFTQSGLTGATIFNILCATGSAFFCFKIAQSSGTRFPLLVIPFLCFAPVYFSSIQSGLTEPFFGFVLVLCIYLFMEKKIYPAAILLSFLPFIRSEGFLILPLFFTLLLYRKKFRAIPLLTLGTVAYSIAGYFYYHDLLWIMHQNPYRGAAALYGSGTWYHFFLRSGFIWGLPLFLLLMAGGAWGVLKSAEKWNSAALERWNKKNEGSAKAFNAFIPSFSYSGKLSAEETILVFGSFFVYFAAHVVFWWQGLFGSLGLIRVMAGIMPLAALVSLRGLNFVLPAFIKNRKQEKIFFSVLIAGMISLAFFHHRNYFSLNKEDVVIRQAAEWIKSSAYKDQKIYFMHPYVSIALDLDRYDRQTNGELWGLDKDDYAKDVPGKSLILWDAHFGPNEGEIKLEGLLNNPSYTLLNKFAPEKEFSTLGGRAFEVYLFVKN